MKRFIFLILLLFPCLANAQWQEARMTPTMAGAGAVAVAGTCSSPVLWVNYSTEVSTDFWSIGSTTSRYYISQDFAGANKTICSVKVWVTKEAGTLIGKTFYAEFWLADHNSANLPANVITNGSATVSGSDGWSNSEVSIQFSSYPTITTGNNYVFSLSMHETDGINYASFRQSNWSNSVGVYLVRWNSDKTINDSFEGTLRMQIYTDN